MPSPSPPRREPTPSNELPQPLFSIETLEWLGLEASQAATCMRNWELFPEGGRSIDGGPIDFDSMATGHTRRGVEDVSGYDDAAWFALMRQNGVNCQLQDAIMDPRFKDIRLTESCQFWVRDSIKMRWRALISAIEASPRYRELEVYRRMFGPAEPHKQEFPGMSVCATEATRLTDGFTLLWRAVQKERAKRAFAPDGTVTRWAALLSYPTPSDFCFSSSHWWTPEYDMAYDYARYARRRSNLSEIVLVSLVVPDTCLGNINDRVVIENLSPTWKQLVHLSRRGEKPPVHMADIKDATLLIGPMLKIWSDEFRSKDDWEQLDENYVLTRADGRPAMQYVFHHATGEDWLEEHCNDRVTMHPILEWELAGEAITSSHVSPCLVEEINPKL